MKTCPKCGAVLRDSDVYCPKCGRNMQTKRVNPVIFVLIGMVGVLLFALGGIVLSLKSSDTSHFTHTAIPGSESSSQSSQSTSSRRFIMAEPDFQFFPASSYELLSEEDLSILRNVTQCRIAYNEIYAKKGRIMNTAGMKRYFEGKNWYRGMYKTVSLNPIETENCQRISNYAHARGWYWKSGDQALNEADLYIDS